MTYLDSIVDGCAALMAWCGTWCASDWLSVLAFTAVTKILLLPLSLWCQANGLRMVSLMPACNRLRIVYADDAETLGNETAALFRRVRYRPLLTLVPLAAQVMILLCLVRVIGDLAAARPGSWLGLVPARAAGASLLMPLFAGAAAWLFGFCQNRFNPLQREQSRAQQRTTNGVSIALSLVLGCFVTMGVGFYWAASNLLSIPVQLLCNLLIRPAAHVDYPDLRRSQAELAEFLRTSRTGAAPSAEDRRRERCDFRRFFQVANKHLVFYAEEGGSFKYFRRVLESILETSNATVHYVTSDPNDPIFTRVHTPAALGFALPPDECAARLRTYYIGSRRIIPLMMRLDADMVVMTTPDLETFHIKRSYVRKDVEYVYLDHGTSSMSMVFRKGAFDHFDTIFLNGPFLEREFRASEALSGSKHKTLVPTGYLYLGDLMARDRPEPPTDRVKILLAPSHQPGNILESCLDEVLSALARVPRVRVVLRPHPQFVRRFPAKWADLKAKHATAPLELLFDDDFSKPAPLFESHLVLTDWSSIAYEFSLVTKRPSIQVNTPMKVINPDYRRLGIEPTDITFRTRIGRTVEVAEVSRLDALVGEMLAEPARFAAEIETLLKEAFYDPLKSGDVAADYILETLRAKEAHRS